MKKKQHRKLTLFYTANCTKRGKLAVESVAGGSARLRLRKRRCNREFNRAT